MILTLGYSFLLPLQFAIDKAIANQARAGSADGVVIDEYMYTDLSQKELEEEIRVR